MKQVSALFAVGIAGAALGLLLSLSHAVGQPPTGGGPPSSESRAVAAGTDRVSIRHGRSIALNDGTVRGVAFSPDGRTVAGCGDRFVHLFDVKTGDRLRRLKGDTAEVRGLAFSPDGRLLASAGADKTIRLWEVKSGNMVKVLKGGKFPVPDVPRTCVAFFPDGRMLASCGADANVILWDIDTGLGDYRARTNGTTSAYLAFSRDGTRCAVAGGPNSTALG